MPSFDSQVSTQRTLTSSTPGVDRAASISTSPRSVPARRRPRCRPVDRRPRPASARTRRSRRASSLDQRCRPAAAIAIGMHDAALGAAVLLADDDVLRDVDQTTGQVAGVGGPQRGVGQTLAGAVGGDEVLQHGQALAEVGLDRPRDDLALRVGHQTTHAGDLPDLHHVPAGAGVDHHPDRVVLREVGLHLLGDLAGRLGPDLDELLAALLVGDDAALVLLLDLLGLLLVPVEDLLPCPAG